jgi:hypothetical protein
MFKDFLKKCRKFKKMEKVRSKRGKILPVFDKRLTDCFNGGKIYSNFKD